MSTCGREKIARNLQKLLDYEKTSVYNSGAACEGGALRRGTPAENRRFLYIMPIYIIRKTMELHPELAARVFELLVVMLC